MIVPGEGGLSCHGRRRPRCPCAGSSWRWPWKTEPIAGRCAANSASAPQLGTRGWAGFGGMGKKGCGTDRDALSAARRGHQPQWSKRSWRFVTPIPRGAGARSNAGWKTWGVSRVPPPSTITDILHRHGLIAPEEGRKHRPWQRFEAPAPNALWQMDFKGYFALADGSCCHPLTVLDDHSRFCLGLRACPDEQRQTVQN